MRSRAGLVPVAGAIIVYPDGSTQTSDANGRFDSSQSDYVVAEAAAAGGGEDLPDAPVVVQPPAGSELEPLEEDVMVAPASQEATWESGGYTSAEFDGNPTNPQEPGQNDLTGVLARSASDIWSDQSSDYLYGGAHFDYVDSVSNGIGRGTGYDASVVTVEFDTTYRTWFVPYYAIVNTPGYIEYEWAANWSVRRNALKEPLGWRWQIVTITRGRPANRVALSVWAQAWVGRYVPLTIFEHR